MDDFKLTANGEEFTVEPTIEPLPTPEVPKLPKKPSFLPKVEDSVTINPHINSWAIILRDAGIHSDAELLALGDDKIVNLLNRIVDKREFIQRLAKLREGK